MGGSLGLPLQIGRRNSVKVIDIIEIQKCSIKKHQDFNSDFLITPPCLVSLAAVFVSSRNAPPLETSPVQDKITMMKKKTTTTKEI